jgi:hypothetical protein
MRILLLLPCVIAVVAVSPAKAAPISDSALHIAQITTSPAATGGAGPLSPAEQRMLRRFPQPVRVGDLIGLPVIDENHRTIGYARKVVRTAQNKVELIVDYDGWFGWKTHPVAVPIEVVGIQGRELASIDMPRSDYVTAPAWQQTDETAISDDDSVKIALSKL